MTFLKRDLNTAQIYGSGVALLLLMAIGFYATDNPVFIHILFGAAILLMVWPAPFRIFGLFWFALGEALGYVVSRILMGAIYLVLVVPIGFVIRKSLRQNMQLTAFKKENASAFKHRDILFTEKDFEKPF